MKKRTIWLIIALCCVIIGTTIFVSGMSKIDWNFKKLGSYNFETNSYEIVDEFNKIEINAKTANINFQLAEDGQCKVVCYEHKKEKHLTSVDNGVLKINYTNEKRWYDYLHILSNSPKITVYLPDLDNITLTIKVSTGDVKLPSDFTFESISISGSTCHVKCYASSINQTKIHVSTGDIIIENTTAKNYDLHVTTGDTKMTNVNCENIVSTGSTGDIKLNNVIASEKISIERSTGKVKFYRCDANELKIITSTGDVEGTLLSDKVFIVKSSTGDIDVPSSITGGRCEITTSTGDIEVRVVN
jgi:DUF4097 and DUF4098 domain-containing protein YvlB